MVGFVTVVFRVGMEVVWYKLVEKDSGLDLGCGVRVVSWVFLFVFFGSEMKIYEVLFFFYLLVIYFYVFIYKGFFIKNFIFFIF